jgi:four helix bundle protein
MKDYKQLIFWRESHHLALDIYILTKKFPNSEIYGITSQIRRSALSVPTNIVEGCGRESIKELRRFLVIASGSITELEYLILFCSELKYITQEEYEILHHKIISLKKTITAYKNKLI